MACARRALPEDQGRASAAAVRRRSGARRALRRRKAPGSSSTIRRTASPTRPCGCSLRLARARGVEARRDAMFRGEKINVTREPRRAARGAAGAARCARSWSTARTSCPRCTRCSTGWRPLPTGCARGAWKGHTGKRIRNVVNIGIGGSLSRAGDGLSRAAAFSDRVADLPLRLQRRRRRLHRGDRRTWTRARRCSSSPPRPSPRWRP